MYQIKFGTDGWRAIIADDYTVENVARVADATARWVKAQSANPSIVLGYDCRFGGKLFAETTIKMMYAHGVKVFYDAMYCTTPMISLAAVRLQTVAGVIITASHNPPTYNGFKLKSGFGGPTPPTEIARVESLIESTVAIPKVSLEEIAKAGLLEMVDYEKMYLDEVNSKFDIETIKKSKMNIVYDAMYGSGQRIFPKLFPDAKLLHCDYNPSFKGIAPEPVPKNLEELSTYIKQAGNIHFALVNDGDADRIAIYDSKGNYIDAHHIILMLIHILHKYKSMNGKVVVAFSASPKIKKMCDAYGLTCEITKIGFKYIAEIMVNEDVLVGGEESGGIAVKGHIPERDGIWDGLVVLEHLAKYNKTIEALIAEIYEVVGSFAYHRNDLYLTEEKKQAILKNCESNAYQSFGGLKVLRVETIDGYKYFLENEQVVMIRASGTEPLLRVYGEAANMDLVNALLKASCAMLLES
ncbi:MAG: phosphoglucomutase/phosphomannomutase family protein [Bacteroidetes bacterium]|nr:phosphoglucomutase/phosphomannomutase family protein [Bacteroidota bacterium]